MTDIFNPAAGGIPDILTGAGGPQAMPEAPGAGDAVAKLSPFKEALDIDTIIARLQLDKPLSLYVPGKEKYPGWEFRIINSVPREVADAHNKGWKEVDDDALMGTFRDLVAGTDKEGKAYRPILCARPKQVGEHVRDRYRMQLRSLYAGMDPRNKDVSGKYTKGVEARDGTFLDREGAPWNIRMGKRPAT